MLSYVPFGAEQLITSDTAGAWSARTADLDADGDLDVLSASQTDNKVAWYENLGAGAFSDQNVLSASFQGASNVFGGDLDSDGDTDVLASTSYGTIAWWENLGDKTFSAENVISSTAAGWAYSIFPADMDGDGDVDVLSALEEWEYMAWFENLGAGEFSGAQEIPATALEAWSVHAADLDADGDLDIVAAGEHVITWLENLGGGDYSTEHYISADAEGVWQLETADLDNDGDADIVSASEYDNEVAWYENLGAGSFSGQQIISSNILGADGVDAADLDGDGDIDILSSAYSDNKVFWHENLGGGSFAAERVVSPSTSGASGVEAADIDGDGYLDVLMAAYDGDEVAWRRNLLSMPTVGPVAGTYDIALFTDAHKTMVGLVGSYIDESLPASNEPDWRKTQTIAGTRVDEHVFFFGASLFGSRAEVGLTKGTDTDWEDFSIQWDGFVEVQRDDTILALRNRGGARMWVDRDGDGAFNDTEEEFIDSNWGAVSESRTHMPLPLPAGMYAIRIQFESNTGDNNISLSTNPLPQEIGFELYTDATEAFPGLVGSYVDQALGSVDEWDWRITQTISGTRVDPEIDFQNTSWGARSEVGLTSGSDSDWELFSVQWDGYVRVLSDGLQLRPRSDDGSRLWVDANLDGVFSQDELRDCGWGLPHAPYDGQATAPLAPGLYPIRIQYEEQHWGNVMQLVQAPLHRVRVGYVVPASRPAQEHALENIAESMTMIQEFYGEQLDRYGLGNESFVIETETDGVTPKVHYLELPVDEDWIRQDIWGRLQGALAGIQTWLWQAGEVWVLFPDVHKQNPDGSIDGGVALGTGWGNNSDSGLAMFGTASLAFFNEDGLSDDRPYDGMIVDSIGPYALVQGVSFPWFEGATISSVISSHIGATAHELGHGFGLPHDGRNDNNFHGNMMGNGLRGFRGWRRPDLYPADDMRLSRDHALQLSASRYFREADDISSTTAPTVSAWVDGSDPVDGSMEIHFSASDDDGLKTATLLRNGETLGGMTLSGDSASGTFTTPCFTTGSAETYTVLVYDVNGSKGTAQVNVTPTAGAERAPVPHIKLGHSQTELHAAVIFDASGSYDPDGPRHDMLVEWDLNGDGIFDTAPTTEMTAEFSYDTPGVRLITARLTDQQGRQSVSAPIALRVDQSIMARYTFYNQSLWDGDDGAATPGDDNAIATDVTALLPGQAVGGANISGYSSGLNGIMIDIDDLPDPAGLTLATLDEYFDFQVAAANPPVWTDAPIPIEVTVRQGAGTDNSDRVTIIWENGDIQDTWLRVTTLANVETTGLVAEESFCFGNLSGDVADSATLGVVDLTDLAVLASQWQTTGHGLSADINADGIVNLTDLALLAANWQDTLPPLPA